MWVEAEKNRKKWSCESNCRAPFLACIPQPGLIYSVSTQTSGGPPPCTISRTAKELPPSGFLTGRISRVFRNLQLHLPTVSARMATLRRSFRTWGSCMRPIIRQRAPGRPSMTIRHLLDWVSEPFQSLHLLETRFFNACGISQEKPSTSLETDRTVSSLGIHSERTLESQQCIAGWVGRSKKGQWRWNRA